MMEQKFIYVDANYLKELEETAKKVDYYKGIIDGINMVADRKTDNCSEKPNNCEAKNYCDDCLFCNTCDSKDFFWACTQKATRGAKTEPTGYNLSPVDKDISNSSEKPNNCEHITENGVTCAKYPACDDCPNNPLNKVKGFERLVKGSEQTDCQTCKWWSIYGYCVHRECKGYEPQTERSSE